MNGSPSERSRGRTGSPGPRWPGRLVALAVAAFLVSGSARAAQDIAVPGEAIYPESVTSTADGTLYVSSIVAGGIRRVPAGARTAEVWIQPGAFNSRSIFGLLADETSNTLWACSNDISGLGIKGPSDVKGSWLLGFDLKTGAGKVSAALPGTRVFCNDIALGPDGSAFVTNTAAPQILRLRPGAASLDVWASDPQFDPKPGEAGLDGLVFGPDGSLFVDTFTRAELFRVDVKDGNAALVTRLQPSRPLVLADEMRRMADGSILLVEGGGRLDRMTVSGNHAEITVLQGDIAGGPTGVAAVGQVAWVSVGQLSVAFNPKRQGQPELPFRLIAVPLDRP